MLRLLYLLACLRSPVVTCCAQWSAVQDNEGQPVYTVVERTVEIVDMTGQPPPLTSIAARSAHIEAVRTQHERLEALQDHDAGTPPAGCARHLSGDRAQPRAQLVHEPLRLRARARCRAHLLRRVSQDYDPEP